MTKGKNVRDTWTVIVLAFVLLGVFTSGWWFPVAAVAWVVGTVHTLEVWDNET